MHRYADSRFGVTIRNDLAEQIGKAIANESGLSHFCPKFALCHVDSGKAGGSTSHHWIDSRSRYG